jgi:phosphoribosylanthranilate isomerase
MVRVKVCGVTSVDSALAAARAGADAIGLNFVGGPRQITPEQACEIVAAIPALIAPVALVRLERGRVPDDLLEFLGQFWISYVQIYGDLSSDNLALLAQDGFKPMPVVSVRDERFADSVNGWLSGLADPPAAIVLDAYDAEHLGGTGKAFQWEWVQQAAAAGKLAGWPPIILAGGLTPENVADAIRAVRPYGVDVSSGVEAGSPGIKDYQKTRLFVRRAKCDTD